MIDIQEIQCKHIQQAQGFKNMTGALHLIHKHGGLRERTVDSKIDDGKMMA
jgi:hypothetical protein